ncbi:MAG: D-hexose-6-phosphate mutarotase [Pseudoxanthomonas sp.]
MFAPGLQGGEVASVFPAHTAFAAAEPVAAPAASSAPVPEVDGVRYGRYRGFDALLISAADATAAIALSGGHLLSFVPRGQQEVLWLSPHTALPPQPTRGGVPVLWPYFSRQGQRADMPAHGLVRTARWQLRHAARHADGTVTVTLAPPELAGLPLSLRMTVRVGRTLEQSLLTTNIGNAPVRFTQALHTYYRVGDLHQVQVNGLEGARYRDKHEHFARTYPQHGPLVLADTSRERGIDRLYAAVSGRYTLVDPSLRRTIQLETTGSRSLVAWSPGASAQERMPDVGTGWRHYLCLEAANAGEDVVELAAGAQARLTQRISVTPLTSALSPGTP